MALPGSIDIEVPIFGSVVVDRPPENLPIGTSPANQDCQYGPGYVRTRPGLAPAIPHPVPIIYQKTYTDPVGVKRELLLDINGDIFQDISGVQTDIFAGIISNSYAKSVTAFGREYIAFSNGRFGSDIPRQYDGTNFDRYTQSGPGRGPVVGNLNPPSATIANPGGTATANIVAGPTGAVRSVPVDITIHTLNGIITITYDSVVTITTTAPHGFAFGQQVTLAGVTPTASGFNGQYTISSVPSPTTFTFNQLGTIGTTGGGGTASVALAPSLARFENIVTVTTTTPHGFQAGWTVAISNVANIAHGGGIASITNANGIVTVITNAAHGLVAETNVIIAGVADDTYNGTFPIATIVNATTFTYVASPASTSSTGGTVSTTFNGLFLIQTVPSLSTFTYAQIGPNEIATSGGTATIVPQTSAGLHLVSVSFITRTGYITAPSPPVLFDATGSDILFLSDIPIGPDNVVARLLMFTPFMNTVQTFGNFYSVLPEMQINDNTTTSIAIDFADAILQAGTSQNYLFRMHKLNDAAGVTFYNSRLFWWGERSYLTNVLNTDFDGGWTQHRVGSTTELDAPPRGWIAGTGATAGSRTTSSDFGDAYLITGDGVTAPLGMITQPAYQDINQQPIIAINTNYSIRLKVAPANAFNANGNLTVDLFSATLGMAIGTFTFTGLAAESVGPILTKQGSIPTDLQFRLYTAVPFTGTITIDSVEVFNTDAPFVDSTYWCSYAGLPEQLDNLTGLIQVSPQNGQILTNAYISGDYLYLAKEASLRVTRDDGTNEPSLWSVQSVSDTVGCCSINGAGSSLGQQGENWTLLPNRNGLFIAEGQNQPIKIMQEIQDDPTGLGRPNWDSINWDFGHTIWAVIDISNRFMAIGVPMFGAQKPNMILFMNFRVLGDGDAMASSSPVYVSSYTGRILSKETQRKWSFWSIAALSGALIEQDSGVAQFQVGLTAAENYPGPTSPIPSGWTLSVTADGGTYALDNSNTSDIIVTGGVANFWTVYSFYETAFLPDAGKRTELQQLITTSRVLMDYVTFYIIGNGNLKVFTLLPGNKLIQTMPNPTAPNLALSDPAVRDFEVFVNTTGERIALLFTAAYPPLLNGVPQNVSSWFELSKLMPSMRSDPAITARGFN